MQASSPSQSGNVSHSRDAMIAHIRGLKVCFLTRCRIQEPWEIQCDLFNSPSLELGDWCRMFVQMSLSQSPLRAVRPSPCRSAWTSLFPSTAPCQRVLEGSWEHWHSSEFQLSRTQGSQPGKAAGAALQGGCLNPEVDFQCLMKELTSSEFYLLLDNNSSFVLVQLELSKSHEWSRQCCKEKVWINPHHEHGIMNGSLVTRVAFGDESPSFCL